MLIGIDPFNDEDTMMVYQKIIKGKIKFPKNIEKYKIFHIFGTKSIEFKYYLSSIKILIFIIEKRNL